MVRGLSKYHEFGSVGWANDQLSYAIQVLKGRKMVCRPKGRLHLALIFKESLSERGFWWQSQILEVWIRRFQKGEFSEGVDGYE